MPVQGQHHKVPIPFHTDRWKLRAKRVSQLVLPSNGAAWAHTGMPWCDLFVRCAEDYHLERIHVNVAKGADEKQV